MSDIKESPCSKQSLWRNGKAPPTLMLNQHLMTFLGAALAHVSNAGEPTGWKHPCMEIYCPVKGGAGYELWVELQPDPAALSELWRSSAAFSLSVVRRLY